MHGVPYKYEINEAKQIIKLRPTVGSLIAFTGLSLLPLVALFGLAALADSSDPEPELVHTKEEL